ncbi:MAG: phenylalanine--tRNA ligase subunit alpha [Anaerolineaceae bacterium]|nr:MAG: phenylalanine--tRNA ligase subunit alpha [Anaerolineaceae bacterium]
MLEQLQAIEEEALAALEAASDEEALKAWSSRYIGKKGAVTQVLRGMGGLPAEERPRMGKAANEAKVRLEAAYEQRAEQVEAEALARDLAAGAVDISLPGRTRKRGGLHPSTRTLRRFYEIWGDMGFQVYRSRDVELDDINFTALNIPPHHPARDMQDTFYTTDEGVILRTHTSPGQIHAMRELGADGTQPIRVILPGMCYRYEQITARSEVQFHQVEGLVVGRNIRMSDLKGTITEFAKRMFNPSAQVRFRASYFPFTEPSMEIDVECFLCAGKGCNVCKYTGWLEIAGCGMVNPVVLRNGGYDPSEWSGFAFGMGPERITMLKHGITDIRYFWGNDLRFLEQF